MCIPRSDAHRPEIAKAGERELAASGAGGRGAVAQRAGPGQGRPRRLAHLGGLSFVAAPMRLGPRDRWLGRSDTRLDALEARLGSLEQRVARIEDMIERLSPFAAGKHVPLGGK